MGQISLAIPPSWLHAPSSPSPESQHPPPPPFLFIQSFQGRIPPILSLYQRETASKGIPQISVLYTLCPPHPISLRPAFLPVFAFSLFPSHWQVMCAFRDFITQGTSASPSQWQQTHSCIEHSVPLSVCLCMFPCSLTIHLISTHCSTFRSVIPTQGWIWAMTDYNPCSFVWQKQEVKQNRLNTPNDTLATMKTAWNMTNRYRLHLLLQ